MQQDCEGGEKADLQQELVGLLYVSTEPSANLTGRHDRERVPDRSWRCEPCLILPSRWWKFLRSYSLASCSVCMRLGSNFCHSAKVIWT